MRSPSLGSGSGRQVGAEECWFCATPEGYLEEVKWQSVVIAFLPTGIVEMPAMLLTFPRCSVWQQVSAWLQDLCDYCWLFSTIYLLRWILKLFWVLCVLTHLPENSYYSAGMQLFLMFMFVTRFSPRAIYGASITCMKWDLKLKNLDSIVAVRSSDTVLFFSKKSLWWKQDSGKPNFVLSTDLNFCWAPRKTKFHSKRHG